MNKEELREKISKTFFSYETKYGKKCIDEVMTFIDTYLKEQLMLGGVVLESEELCVCDAPLIRTSDKGGEYCGNCGKDID